MPDFVKNAIKDLQNQRVGNETKGRIFDSSGRQIGNDVKSGSDSATSDIDKFLKDSPNIENTRARSGKLLNQPAATHVETKYAWWLRQQENTGIKDVTVVINNAKGVCGYPFGCQSAVRAILPRGTTMRVWYPGATEPEVLEGLG